MSNHPLLELPTFGPTEIVYNFAMFAGKRKFYRTDILLPVASISQGTAESVVLARFAMWTKRSADQTINGTESLFDSIQLL
ncbi:MAG: hypothetical protein MK161_15860 [Pirellulales bacterium]|nr:hypothetical protein [Pirellulales bacterium]